MNRIINFQFTSGFLSIFALDSFYPLGWMTNSPLFEFGIVIVEGIITGLIVSLIWHYLKRLLDR